PVRQADESRHDRAEDHDQRMHRGHAVEEHRIDELQPGLEQLGADDQSHYAADEEHRQAEQQIHRADVFMVGREDPAAPALLRAVIIVMRLETAGGGMCGAHGTSYSGNSGARRLLGGGQGGRLRFRTTAFEPRGILRLRLHFDHDRHECVIAAAQLGALAAVYADFVGAEPKFVDEAGDRVLLHAEFGHPPGVDDVGGREQYAHLGAYRHDHAVVDFEQVVLDAARIDAGAELARCVAASL